MFVSAHQTEFARMCDVLDGNIINNIFVGVGVFLLQHCTVAAKLNNIKKKVKMAFYIRMGNGIQLFIVSTFSAVCCWMLLVRWYAGDAICPLSVFHISVCVQLSFRLLFYAAVSLVILAS